MGEVTEEEHEEGEKHVVAFKTATFPQSSLYFFSVIVK